MPRLSRERRVAMGASPQQLSYDGNVISWDANPPLPVYSFANTPILGRQIAWLNDWTLIFESSQSGTARLYTYDTRTGVAVQVSSTGADRLRASGDVWAAWLSASGYRDSNSRTHADYGAIGVDDDGTVLVVLNDATQKGLGYLLPTAASASDVVVITYDTIVTEEAAIRNGVVIYRANGVLNRYVIQTEESTVTNIPFVFKQNDGNWMVGAHTQGLGVVVVEFGETEGFQVTATNDNFAPDIRVATDGFITVATSKSQFELSTSIGRYLITQAAPKYSLYADKNNTTVTLPGLGPTSELATTIVVASDIITVRANTADNTGTGRTVIIPSTDWFGSTGGKDLRAAWQFGLTAVVAATNASASEEVTVKNNSGNTYASGRTSYGNSSVMIRPAPTSSNTAPLWEITWVANSTTYSRVTLNANLAPTTSIANTTLTFGNRGILDINATSNAPITGDANQTVKYGYVVLQDPITRGQWTVGKDVSPTCNTSRLVAWKTDTQKAYVVWNGTIDGPAHLALQYDSEGREIPRVVPSRRIFALQEFLEIGQIDIQIGSTPGLPTPVPAPNEPAIYVPGVPPAWPWSYNLPPVSPSFAPVTPTTLKTNTRVFRVYQTIPPTAKVLEAVNTKGTPLGGGGAEGACDGVTWPAPGADPTNPYYYELPPGISIDSGAIYQQMRQDILNSIGLDIDKAEDREKWGTQSGCDDGGPFNPQTFINYASKPDQLSDGRWTIGWQGYLLSRVENAYNTGDCATGNPGRASSANVIDAKWTSKWPCAS